MTLFKPSGYTPTLSVQDTQEAIKYIRDTFQKEFGRELGLTRVSAPLFVTASSGLNDDLNGIERPVCFDAPALPGEEIQIVQSLAKWKRYALKQYGYGMHEGFYTNMNAVRRDEVPDNTHSIYVDQWDWEKIIRKEERTEQVLEDTVRTIFKVFKHMEHEVWYKYPQAVCHLADDVFFITSGELEERYPDLTPKEREDRIVEEKKCVFIKQIGWPLSHSGKPHDGRAPDYDDWNLNGDLLFWLPSLQMSLELSSMGIRVDEESVVRQCKFAGKEDRLSMPYHQMVINKELPYTIGGGIGQSRLCMLLLNKAHIGEVQSSLWPKEMLKELSDTNIKLL